MDKLKAPRFLKFLTLLSIIGGIYSIKESIQGLFFFDPEDLNELSYSFSGSEEDVLFINRFIERFIDLELLYGEYRYAIHIPNIILCLVALYGVYLMYNLKREGFLYYSISKVLIIIIPFILFFNNAVGQFFIAVQFFITGTFIFAYATQVKYMVAGKSFHPKKE